MHIDAFELPKFDRPGHWAHGDRSEPNKSRGAGKIKVIGVIDDHTRLVAETVWAFSAASGFIRYYNRRRPHTAAGGRAPIPPVH